MHNLFPHIALTLSLAYAAECSFFSHPPERLPFHTKVPNIPLVRSSHSTYQNLNRRSGVVSQSISNVNNFWFAKCNVGLASNLTLLIDTGSGDVVLNPGVNISSPESINTNVTFSNGYGTTKNDGTGTSIINGTIILDTMSFGGLKTTQPIGITSEDETKTPPFPGDGIVGFSGDMFKQFPGNTPSFFQSLCESGKLDECRFGLVLGAEEAGTLVLGGLDSSLYIGDITVAPAITGWVIAGDLAINGDIVATDLVIEMDSGTATIVGPLETVSQIFNATGIQGVISETADGPFLTGYFPCNAPPSVGFRIPSQSNASTLTASAGISVVPTIFNIPNDAWVAKDNGNNNCTAVLGGQNYAAFPGLWVVGQPFFQGRYIDHDLENGMMGFVAANTTSTSTSPPSNTTLPVVGNSSSTGLASIATNVKNLAIIVIGIAVILM
ncbi:Gastricsin [Phlyctema vagabunda]|uniref:Gastricsin n=1 Tax=Phlyctema vagabunda TaxID=108571 RepID=A0ABR4PHJ0_9HELO